MLGLSIIQTSELKRLQDVDELFSKLKMGAMNEENYHLKQEIKGLKDQVEALTPKRANNGKFVKK